MPLHCDLSLFVFDLHGKHLSLVHIDLPSGLIFASSLSCLPPLVAIFILSPELSQISLIFLSKLPVLVVFIINGASL